ncbi:Uncharacterised protein [Burkholderia pseudomallei]|nr:Uncharacterised protein [Burkholderia pseudomallei]
MGNRRARTRRAGCGRLRRAAEGSRAIRSRCVNPFARRENTVRADDPVGDASVVRVSGGPVRGRIGWRRRDGAHRRADGGLRAPSGFADAPPPHCRRRRRRGFIEGACAEACRYGHGHAVQHDDSVGPARHRRCRRPMEQDPAGAKPVADASANELLQPRCRTATGVRDQRSVSCRGQCGAPRRVLGGRQRRMRSVRDIREPDQRRRLVVRSGGRTEQPLRRLRRCDDREGTPRPAVGPAEPGRQPRRESRHVDAKRRVRRAERPRTEPCAAARRNCRRAEPGRADRAFVLAAALLPGCAGSGGARIFREVQHDRKRSRVDRHSLPADEDQLDSRRSGRHRRRRAGTRAVQCAPLRHRDQPNRKRSRCARYRAHDEQFDVRADLLRGPGLYSAAARHRSAAGAADGGHRLPVSRAHAEGAVREHSRATLPELCAAHAQQSVRYARGQHGGRRQPVRDAGAARQLPGQRRSRGL